MPLVSQTAIDAVRRYTEGNMDGSVTVLRGARGELDKTTGRVSGMVGGTPVYDGKARVHLVTGQGSLSLGPGQVNIRQTTVSIPWGAPVPQRDDLVLIRDAGQDDTLTGAALRVVEVSGGGLFGDARRMSCTLWGKSAQWDGTG